MDFNFTVLALIALVVVVIGVIGYMATTNSIIRSQEREIAELRRTLTRYERESPRKNTTDVKFEDF